MKTFFASLLLLATIALICSPILMVWCGITGPLPFRTRILLIAVGLIFCRLVKPLSIITGRDLKYI